MVEPLPKCEVCGGAVYRRLKNRPDGVADWVGDLWHLDMTFLDADDPSHEPALTNPPDVIPLHPGLARD